MKIYANGFPKTGTHALKKAIELLGCEAELKHEPHKIFYKKMVVIFRNPRNVLVSECRWQYKRVTTGRMILTLRKWEHEGATSFYETMAEEYSRYLHWKEDPNVLCVNYEDLIKDDKTLRKIADYLGVPYLEDAFPNLEGLTRTWNRVKSNWEKYWSPEVEKVWKETRADLLEEKLK